MVVLCNLHTGGSAASIIMTPVATYAAAVSPVLTTLVASIRVGAGRVSIFDFSQKVGPSRRLRKASFFDL